MSVQTNQFLIWGLRMPYNWHKQWEQDNGKEFCDTFDEFMDDSAFEPTVKHKDGIFCLFDGMNGKYIIIGRVLSKSKDGTMLGDEPIMLHSPTKLEKEFIRNAVVKNFGIDGDFRLWFVTQYS